MARVLTLLWLSLLLSVVASPLDAAEPTLGVRSFIGGSWFRDLGTDADGAQLWGYPHREGIEEIFRETGSEGGAASAPWSGDLGSEFDRRSGKFLTRFLAAERVEDLAAGDATSAQKDASARILQLVLEEWRRTRGDEPPPYYFRKFLKRIELRLGPADLLHVEEQIARRVRVLARVPLRTPAALLPNYGDYRDYHAALIEDGYLDFTIVVGNAYDRKSEEYRSRELLESLHGALLEMGFRDVGSGNVGSGGGASIDCERNARILGRRVRVRARLTGGARLFPHIRHAVANFVEGLANADVVLYHGHSNRGSAHCISESHDAWSRFDIACGSDLTKKCYGLKEKPYQIFVLQSCESYERYCRPIRERLDDEYATRPGSAGFIGTADSTYFNDLPPRLTALVEGLIAGSSPRAMERSLDTLRPLPGTPPVIVRGLLQPTDTFIVPTPPEGEPPIEITNVRELGAKYGNRIVGEGSDGERVIGTAMFPQDSLGEVVQIVEADRLVYALYADGTVSRVGKSTRGAALPAFEETDVVPRFRHICAFHRGSGKGRVRLVAKDGSVYLASVAGDKLEGTEMGPPEGVRFVALGKNVENQVVAIDTAGAQHLWFHGGRKWLAPEAPLTLEGFPPHLGGVGRAGVLVRAAARVEGE